MVLSLKEQIVNGLDKLSDTQQEQLLRIVKGWQPSELPVGTLGEVMLAHMDDFHFEPGEIEEMMRVIEEGCGQIAWDAWK